MRYLLDFHSISHSALSFLQMLFNMIFIALQWRHNEYDNFSNHQPHDCLLNRLFSRRLKKTSKLHVTGLCAENSPGTGEFPAQMASYAENVSNWWRHHGDSRAIVHIPAGNYIDWDAALFLYENPTMAFYLVPISSNVVTLTRRYASGEIILSQSRQLSWCVSQEGW